MAIALRKEVVVRLPMELYEKAKEMSDNEYKTFSGFIRGLIAEKVSDRLSDSEVAEAAKASREFRAGHGVSWRKIKRG